MRLTSAIPAAVLIFFLGASGAHAHGGQSPSTGEKSFGRPGLAKDVTRTVAIEAGEYAFAPDLIAIQAGETVKFVVTNKGRLMHELTIGDAAEQDAHSRAMDKMSDMTHDDGKTEMPSNAVHVPPGETRELIWTFAKGGDLKFACNYPGHTDLGMKGDIVVK